MKIRIKTKLNEQEQRKYGIGAVTFFEKDWSIRLSLVDLDVVASQLGDASPEEFFKKLSRFKNGKEFQDARDNAVVGFVQAYNAEKLKSGPAGAGGICYYTYEIRTMIGRGFGEELFSCLFGMSHRHDKYITIDRRSVTDDAWGWWESRVKTLNDTVPPNEDPYIGKFDDVRNPVTDTGVDDCIIHPDHPLGNKGYKGTSNHENVLKSLEQKTNFFFDNFIKDKVEEPGFFGKLFGSTKDTKIKGMKDRFIDVGDEKFRNWWLNRGK